MKIHDAVIKGDLDSVKKLVTNGADVNEINDDGNGGTPLYCAVTMRYLNIVEYLLANKADPNKPTPWGTPLDGAVLFIKIFNLKSMLINRVDPNNHHGALPLTENILIIECLLAAGANYQEMISKANIISEIVKTENHVAIIDCLIPDENGLPAYLSQLKSSPDAIDESTRVIGINLPEDIKNLIIEFTFFKPSKRVLARLAQHDKHSAGTQPSMNSCCNIQ